MSEKCIFISNNDIECTGEKCQKEAIDAIGGKEGSAVGDDVSGVDRISPKEDAKNVDRADVVPMTKNAKSVQVLEPVLQKGSAESITQGDLYLQQCCY